MKFLLDENLPASFSKNLVQSGYKARHVSNVGLNNRQDEEIVEFASHSGETIITYDLDFSRIIAATGIRSLSLITIRVTSLNSVSFVKIIQGVLESCHADLEKGAMVTVDDVVSLHVAFPPSLGVVTNDSLDLPLTPSLIRFPNT